MLDFGDAFLLDHATGLLEASKPMAVQFSIKSINVETFKSFIALRLLNSV
jgi:hypothetical protein